MGERRRNVRRGCLGCMVIPVVAGIVAFALVTINPPDDGPEPTNAPAARVAPYQVVASEHQPVARPRNVFRVVIEDGLPPDVAGATLAAAARQALAFNRDADVATVFGFRPGDDALGGGGHTVGKAEISRDGKGWTGDGMFTVGAAEEDRGDVAVSVVTRVFDNVQVAAEETVMRFPREEEA